MSTHLLLFALALLPCLNSPQQPVQPPGAVQVSGICFDATTAVYLPVDVFAVSGGTQIKLGQSANNGTFDFLLPLSATSVSFACRNYRTVTLPVTFVNSPGNGAKFRLGLIMGKLDSAAVQQTHQLVLSNRLPDSEDIDYRVEPTGSNARVPIVATAHGNRVPPGGRLTLKKGRGLPFLTFEGAQPGPYRMAVSTADGRVLVDKAFTVKEGLTFVEVRADGPNQPGVAGSVEANRLAEPALPDFRTVYFEQSRYELNSATQASLDSVAQLLTAQRRMVARITGYTDKVGEPKLNATLAEYRAKRVANYLKQKGIQEAQLLVTWEGGTSATALTDPEATKAKNRRVVIQFDHP